MTHIKTKFGSHLEEIQKAIDGDTDLRGNQKLYKKLYKYYKESGIIFTGDSNLDYNTVLDCLYEDTF